MSYNIDLPPDEMARMVVRAAENAAQEGYWSGPPIREQAARHLERFLGLLLAGDDDIHLREMDLLARVVAAASKAERSHDELRTRAMEAVEMASDPDALHAFLQETPPFMRAILEMDRARGTRNAEQVVTALSGLALAVLAADGRDTEEEDSIFTIHLNHLRGELAEYGVETPPS